MSDGRRIAIVGDTSNAARLHTAMLKTTMLISGIAVDDMTPGIRGSNPTQLYVDDFPYTPKCRMGKGERKRNKADRGR